MLSVDEFSFVCMVILQQKDVFLRSACGITFFFRFQCPFADNYFWMPHELSIKFISSAFLIYNVTQSYHLTKSFRKDIRDAIDSCA